LQPRKLATTIRELALDKKAEDPVILDIAKFTSLAHYFVVTHGNSDRHVRAIAQHIADGMDAKKVTLWHQEGKESGQWVLLDFGAVIVHVFYKDLREFYNLERLWGDAEQI
jgi:ribosome-associated protein